MSRILTNIPLRTVACLWAVLAVSTGTAPAQNLDDSIVSKHVRLRLPFERQWLGRETINDLEKCWAFIDAATDAKLPSRLMIIFDVQRSVSAIDRDRGTISIGLADPTSAKNVKDFLVHGAAREMARMAVMNLSAGAAGKPENLFLLEGMSEMLAHEFSSSVRKQTAAWAITYYRDRISPLGLKQLSAGEQAYTRHTLHTAAPGITLLSTADDLFGRARLLRFFELLAKRSLEESIAAAFKTTVPALEAQWLERVRRYRPADITVTAEDEVPVLDRIAFAPDPARAGSALEVRIYAHDGAQDLTATGVFLVDESSGRVLNARPAGSAALSYAQCELPVAADATEGQHRFQVVAIDEAGNLRNWNSAYTIKR